jgi:hypothetical protein
MVFRFRSEKRHEQKRIVLPIGWGFGIAGFCVFKLPECLVLTILSGCRRRNAAPDRDCSENLSPPERDTPFRSAALEQCPISFN